MLNQSRVLKYIKSNLGFPFQPLELDDEAIWDYVKENTIREWSHYQPHLKLMSLNVSSTENQVPGRQNEYYMEDSEGLEILNIIGIYFNISQELFTGHPLWGPMGMGELKDWALNVEVAGMLRKFSSYVYEGKFVHPNKIRITPAIDVHMGTASVEYETIQPEDLSGIRNDLQMYFQKLALADIMIVIGRVRKRYGENLRTPFGEIPLSSEILEEGKEMKREILEKLEQTYIPNITFSKG